MDNSESAFDVTHYFLVLNVSCGIGMSKIFNFVYQRITFTVHAKIKNGKCKHGIIMK